MLRASALYVVIIVSLLIAVISSSLISTAYFYRLEYQKNERFNKLLGNLSSGTAILLSEDFKEGTSSVFDLYGEGGDSVAVSKEQWGAFGLATSKAFVLKDTLKKAFFTGQSTGKDNTAIYLADEDRPLSVSGNTRITGDVLLPKAGIKQAYVESKPYSGDKLVYGSIKPSSRSLPALSANWIESIVKQLAFLPESSSRSLPDSLHNSFFNPVMSIQVKGNLDGQRLSGKIALYSDTVLKISKDTRLNDVIIYAKAIVVEAGFRGNCQLFARDSISTGSNCVFTYPSCLAVLKPDTSKLQTLIRMGPNTVFSGIILSYEKNRSEVQTMLSLGKGTRLTGEAYSSGFIKMEKPLTVNGKVSCNRFIIQTPVTLYENYLVDIKISRPERSRYYLTSKLFKPDKPESKVLKWLE